MTPEGGISFFFEDEEKGTQSRRCAKFAYYSECKSGFSHFPSSFLCLAMVTTTICLMSK